MAVSPVDRITTLTFDVFGTILDLEGSLAPPLDKLLRGKGASITGTELWAQWRARQRVEQYQDTLLMLGHSGYLETCLRALVYSLQSNGLDIPKSEMDELMNAYQRLSPFEDAVPGLSRLGRKYRLVALSNGESWFLEHLASNRIRFDFDRILSVEEAGVFKPHPAVYRSAARILGSEPSEIMMVAAHSFDIMGARACGYRGAFVNRYRLPFEETPYRPDIVVRDFTELADHLVGAED